jgi:hypothetical protein
LPAEHDTHAFVGDPVAASDDPDAQEMHDADPEDTWYCPATQLTHAFVVEPVEIKYDPAAQSKHAVELVDVWYWPATQSPHADAPTSAANLPRVHGEHRLLLDPVTPRNVPARHPTQLDDPVDIWYCPAKQLTHAFVDDPVEAKYDPATQLEHTDAPKDV